MAIKAGKGQTVDLIIKEVDFTGSAYENEVDLRYRLLRRPLGLNFTAEQLEQDKADIHIHAYIDGELAACALLRLAGEGEMQMRQVAVEEYLQGQGIGASVVRFAEMSAKQRGINKIFLHARVTVKPFYERLGYRVEGEEYEEVTIPHVTMTKQMV